MWQSLFYDKYAGDIHGNGDHRYNNEITKMTSINDLQDGSYTYYSGKNALEFYNNKFSSNFNLPECSYTSDMFKLMAYHKISNNMELIYAVVGINIKKLEKKIKNKEPIPHNDFLKNLCRFHTAYTETSKFINNSYYYGNNSLKEKISKNKDYIQKNAMEAIDYSSSMKINDPNELNIKLYDYQKCNIYWMKEKELNKKEISYNLNEEIVLGNVYYDIITQKFDLVENKKKLLFHGGAIIDEVGLGKTLQVIGLGLTNKSKSIDYYSENIPNKLVSKATLVLCPNQLCGQWIREFKDRIKKEANISVISIMTKRDFDKLKYVDLLTADYVVVSFTFLGNSCFTSLWCDFVSKNKSFFKSAWNTTNIAQVRKVFSDLGEKLVKEKINQFDIQPLIQLIHWHRIVVDEFHEIYKDSKFQYIANLLPFISADYRWCVTATPFIVNRGLENIVDFVTDFKNVDNDSIYNVEDIIDYLNDNFFRRNTKLSVEQEHTLPPIKEEIRWLKFSPTERMIYNAFLANHNNDRFSVYLRQLCCHPQLAEETKEALSNCKTLEDIEKMMTKHYKDEMDAAKQNVIKCEKKIARSKRQLRKLQNKQKRHHIKKSGFRMDRNSQSEEVSGVSSDTEEDTKLKLITMDKVAELTKNLQPTLTIQAKMDKIKEQENKLKNAKNVLEGKTKTFEFFDSVIERIKKTAAKDSSNKDSNSSVLISDEDFLKKLNDKEDVEDEDNNDEECGICLGEIPEDDIGVTICGHMFCYECIKMATVKSKSCPYCKKKLESKDLYLLSYERKKKVVTQEEKDKSALINEIGTKLANLITYLRESDQHTIIFSQWDDLLRRVGRVLNENKIPNVFCKGNCYQRDKAIREFNTDNKIKVIMLSSDSTAAGTNLTKASQVIFIDPIYGTYEYRKGQEKQAIGRAHRLGQKANLKIVRFIIKDTVEEEIYNINAMEDKKYVSDYMNSNEIVIN